jgi:curli biogenesis system outer membrane secretion channel CsgG
MVFQAGKEIDMKRKWNWVLFLIAICLLVNSFNLLAQTKKRVAVFDFEDKTDHRWHWWTGQPGGEGMADMLTTELVKSGKYQVIERQTIEQIMKEQQLGQTGMVTPQSAAQVGQLLGVELAVIGSVTEFGYKKSDVGGFLKKKGFGLGLQSASASVGIDVRFVNTNTGEIIVADNVRKEESKKGLKVDTKQFSFKNKNDFDESIVGKATRSAIEEIMTKLDAQMGSLPWQAKIVKVTDNTVYINAGSESGVSMGDVFEIYSKGEDLIDPDTGLSLGAEETKVGEIEVTDNGIGNGKASKCIIKSGIGFKQGDLVRQK